MHQAPNSQTPDGELAWQRRASDAIVALTGRRPVGCRAARAAASAHTLDYLLSEGFLYDSSFANDHELSSSTFGRDRCLNSPAR